MSDSWNSDPGLSLNGWMAEYIRTLRWGCQINGHDNAVVVGRSLATQARVLLDENDPIAAGRLVRWLRVAVRSRNVVSILRCLDAAFPHLMQHVPNEFRETVALGAMSDSGTVG